MAAIARAGAMDPANRHWVAVGLNLSYVGMSKSHYDIRDKKLQTYTCESQFYIIIFPAMSLRICKVVGHLATMIQHPSPNKYSLQNLHRTGPKKPQGLHDSCGFGPVGHPCLGEMQAHLATATTQLPST